MIRFDNVCIQYADDVPPIDGISFHVEKGEFVFLTGPSGSGKSSILRVIYGSLSPCGGQIELDGSDLARIKPSQIPFLRRNLGVVFQDCRLLPNRTVFDNVALTLEVQGGRNRSDIKNKVMAILGQVGLTEKAHLKPHRLSGGDQQRAALARALVNEPRILLADEPTGNLDDSTKDQIMALLEQVNLKGTTVMVATHDQRLLERNARRVITLPPPALQRSETSTTVNSSEVSHEQ